MLTILLIAAAIVITLIVRGNIAAENEKKLRRINSEVHKIYLKEKAEWDKLIDKQNETHRKIIEVEREEKSEILRQLGGCIKIEKKAAESMALALVAEVENREMAERAYGQAKDLIAVLNLKVKNLEYRIQKPEAKKDYLKQFNAAYKND